MARKKHIYTHEFPSHIRARSNNQHWFQIPMDVCWEIFSEKLLYISSEFGFKIHAFVLMSNHYHLIGSTNGEFYLDSVMNWFQTSVSRRINLESGSINHVFGGRYKASLIQTPPYYANVMRYVYQNPVRANICEKVESYKYSTIDSKNLIIQEPPNGMDYLIKDMSNNELMAWYNQKISLDDNVRISKALKRTEFKIVPNRNTGRPHWLSEGIDEIGSNHQ